jgi:hypothetical protein
LRAADRRQQRRAGFILYQQGNRFVVIALNLASGRFGCAHEHHALITRSSVADPCIAVDENGGAVLAYFSCVSRWGAWAQTCTPGGGWSAAAVLDDDRAFERALAVGSDGAGNAVVAWKKQVITSASGGSFCDTVHGSHCAAGSSWSARGMLSAPEADGAEPSRSPPAETAGPW